MRLLLDTHVWLWSLLEPSRLNREAASQLEDPSNSLWLSPISVWEALLLIERKRVVVSSPPAAWVAEALGALPVRDAPLNRQVAIASRGLDLEHDDPADRFLAASAKIHELILMTADQRLLRSRQIEVLAAG